VAARLLRPRPLLIRARTYQPGLPKAFSYNRLVDRTLVNSEHLRRRILANPEIQPERIAVLRPIVPLRDLRAEARLPLHEDLAAALSGSGPVIVQAAMLRPEKGHRTALEAIAGLRSHFPALRYVIAGSGPEEAALRQQAAALQLEGLVHFAGLVVPVAPLLARADLVIMPSLDEPLGLAQVEALALGVPVAVSDVGGLPETVTHGDTGWILRAGDVSAWRDGMVDALADPVRARAMAQRGRSFVEATFAPQAHLAALRAELAKAAAAR
jgi:glycosyltransferase involved in cell wall biosynthesis